MCKKMGNFRLSRKHKFWKKLNISYQKFFQLEQRKHVIILVSQTKIFFVIMEFSDFVVMNFLSILEHFKNDKNSFYIKAK